MARRVLEDGPEDNLDEERISPNPITNPQQTTNSSQGTKGKGRTFTPDTVKCNVCNLNRDLPWQASCNSFMRFKMEARPILANLVEMIVRRLQQYELSDGGWNKSQIFSTSSSVIWEKISKRVQKFFHDQWKRRDDDNDGRKKMEEARFEKYKDEIIKKRGNISNKKGDKKEKCDCEDILREIDSNASPLTAWTSRGPSYLTPSLKGNTFPPVVRSPRSAMQLDTAAMGSTTQGTSGGGEQQRGTRKRQRQSANTNQDAPAPRRTRRKTRQTNSYVELDEDDYDEDDGEDTIRVAIAPTEGQPAALQPSAQYQAFSGTQLSGNFNQNTQAGPALGTFTRTMPPYANQLWNVGAVPTLGQPLPSNASYTPGVQNNGAPSVGQDTQWI